MKALYFDNASTTPVDPAVATKMMSCLAIDGFFGNPASTTHGYGWMASEEVEWSREVVADSIGADPREIVWTSGATESDNLAIRGSFEALSEKTGRHRIITLASEHKAVLDTCSNLDADVVVLKPRFDGSIDMEALRRALTPQTLLVSVMLVNNETGVIQPVRNIADMAHASGALMHSDLAQSVGKVVVDVKSLGIDLGALSAHKVHGPKGVGALYVKRDQSIKIAEQQHGGQHERGMRSGTLPTHQLVGMAEAYRLASLDLTTMFSRLDEFRLMLEEACELIGGIRFNGRGVPHIVNLTIEGVEAEMLMAAMPDIALSTGSACNSATLKPSHVLRSMGHSRKEGLSSIRISMGRFTTREEVVQLIQSLQRAVSGLRSQ
jgi:cysteine desulfurase